MKKLTIIVLISAFIISCNSDKNEINIDTQLSRLKINSEFMLDTINVANWDGMIVIGPYLNEKAYSHLEIPESAKEALKKNSMLDAQCTLLFFKGSQFVNYSVVGRNIADFTPLVNENKTYILTQNKKYTLEEGRIVVIKE